jgi:hypothetical protein
MGYKRKTYLLKFEDPEMEGLEVRAKPPSTGVLLRLSSLIDQRPKDIQEAEERVNNLYATFAKVLTSWNLEEEDDTPVPATEDGLATQDLLFVVQIIKAYLRAVYGVSESLKEQSSSGDPILEDSIPMEPLSESPES